MRYSLALGCVQAAQLRVTFFFNLEQASLSLVFLFNCISKVSVGSVMIISLNCSSGMDPWYDLHPFALSATLNISNVRNDIK